MTLDEVAISFAAEHVQAEDRLLAAGWINPTALIDAAIRVGLGGSHFSCARRSIVFVYVCMNGDNGGALNVEDCCARARAEQTILTARDLSDVLSSVPIDVTDLDEAARDIIACAARRDETRGFMDRVVAP